ncbi:hypothetical protein [Novosphingobium kaempferiae]|uniref:hypothetical protein n=1 Tax=Novosphingobium kaempferiae TaxID=2896849 RepID=UPI001E5E8877|nr:hypothetical protein [Novosphingobium kaempferiae]
MATGPQRRRRGAWLGAAVAIAVAMAVSLGLFRTSGDRDAPREESTLGAIRADGKLVLKVFSPHLY